MAGNRPKIDYIAISNLTNIIALEAAKRTVTNGGEAVRIIEIEQELADYCGISLATVRQIKRNVNQASLAVALKICEYFQCPVENLFSLAPPDELKRQLKSANKD